MDVVQAIDTLENQVIATIPVGQLPQALVYVSHATVSNAGNANLRPLGEAAHSIQLQLLPPDNVPSRAQASVSVNLLGPIDNLQIAATGLEPGRAYVLIVLGEGSEQELLLFTAGKGGVAIAQTLGPLKRLDHSGALSATCLEDVQILRIEIFRMRMSDMSEHRKDEHDGLRPATAGKR